MAELFSENKKLPEQMREIMRALAAEKGDRFQTCVFEKTGDAGIGRLWREAWLNPHVNRWEVSEHSTAKSFYAGKEGKIAERRTTLHANLCFFDALYHCALFEVSEGRFGLAPLQKEFEPGQMHYTDFAAREGIPFDQAGMPLLAAYGRILSDGDYDEEARKIAAASPHKLNEAKPAQVPVVSAFSGLNLPVPVTQSKDLSANAQHNLVKMQHVVSGLSSRISAVQKKLEQCREKKFVWCSDTNVFWLNLFPVIGTIILLIESPSLPDSFPRFQFNRSIRKLKAEYNKAADLLDVAPLKQYASDAVLTYKILRAREMTRAYVAHQASEGTVKRCMNAFRASAAKEGWSESTIDAMEKNIGNNANDETFDYNLTEQLSASGEKLKTNLQKLCY